MTTTFLVTNVQTQLKLNAPYPKASYHTPAGQVVQLDNSDRTNSYWRFQSTFDNNQNTFQIINAQTGMALGVQTSAIPTWPGSIRVDNPVMEVPALYGEAQGTASYATQEWAIIAPGLGSTEFGSTSSFEFVVSPFTKTNYSQAVMNAPGNSLSSNPSDNDKVPIQVSPNNGGHGNEVWMLQNTANPAPTITFSSATTYSSTDDSGTNLNFFIENFPEAAEGQILGLPIPIERGDWGNLVGSGSGYLTPISGGNNATGIISISDGAVVEGPRPGNARVTVVVVNAQGYVVALTTVTSDWWYSGVVENG